MSFRLHGGIVLSLLSVPLLLAQAPPGLAQARPATPPAGGALPSSSSASAPDRAALILPPIALPIEQYVLDNGLEVVLHEDHRTPIVAVNLWYHVGSKDEPNGRNGFAHLFEHLMFQGSRNVGEDMFFKYVDRAGASDRNGTTSDDRTNYYETLPSNQLALALWLESDRMGFLLDHVTQETLDSQREVVKNERREHYENAPYGLVYKFVREAVFPPDHPYHRLTIGTPEDLDRATLDDVRTFFRTFYVPNNATLVVAGDIEKAAAKKLVSRYFASIPKGLPSPSLKEPKPVSLERSRVLDIEAEVELARVSMTWPTPPWFAAGDAELDLLAQVLTSGKSSRLYKRLVYDMQVAQNVTAHQASEQLASTFEITVTLKKGSDPKEVVRVVDEELARIRTEGATADEVERGKAEIASRMVFEMEKVGARAGSFNQYNQMAGDPRFFDRDLARYTASSRQAVQNAMRFLPEDKRILAVVRPVKGAPRAGRLLPGGGA